MGPHSPLRCVVGQCNGQFGAKITRALKKKGSRFCFRFKVRFPRTLSNYVILIFQPKGKLEDCYAWIHFQIQVACKDNLEPLENSLSDVGSRALSTQIRSEVLALDEDGIDGSVDLGGGLNVAERRQ